MAQLGTLPDSVLCVMIHPLERERWEEYRGFVPVRHLDHYVEGQIGLLYGAAIVISNGGYFGNKEDSQA